jgi:hypothetical protein
MHMNIFFSLLSISFVGDALCDILFAVGNMLKDDKLASLLTNDDSLWTCIYRVVWFLLMSRFVDFFFFFLLISL